MSNVDKNLSLRRFDLNLLPILKALLTTHSVVRAAEILGLSQSATSSALTRLRGTFGDPLLVMVGRHLVPTPGAEKLLPLLNSAFQDLHVLFDQRLFMPSKEEYCFVISTSDYVVDSLGLPLITLLATEAPLVSVKFVEVSTHHWASMIGGDIDFMITPQNISENKSEDFNSLPLSVDEMVVVSSETFPIPKGGLDLDCYLAASHAAYGTFESESFLQQALRERGLKQRNVITMPQFNQLPRYVATTNCLAVLPRHVAERFVTSHDLRIWPLPFDMPRLEMSVHWSHLLDHNPAHRWFRSQIAQVWNDLFQDEGSS